ncbi:cytochrome P450 [Actinomycetes bacterium]|nr:cytochrome P450 [Actinomycetes bacterium]
MSEISFNPFDPEFRKDPHPFYDRLREEQPVHKTPIGFVVLTRYEDVVNTLRNNDFSRDIELNANLPETATRKYKRENTRSKSILNLDPPDHTRLRRLVSKSFTPSAIEKLRPRIQALVDQSLSNAKKTGHLELVEELAFPVPFQVISDLLAMPTDRGSELREWSQIITATLEPTTGVEDLELAEVAINKMRPYLEEIIEHRRRNMGDDMLSSLIAVEEQGEKLNNDELMSFVILLYIAGHETTVNLIGNSVHALLTHPEQLATMRRESCTQHMVDELLRYNGPVQHTIRTPTVDVLLHVDGQQFKIEKGVLVLASLAAANHDSSVFANPHKLDFSRHNSNRHVAFSAGVHYCLGASLAKLETEIAVGTLVREFKNIQIEGEPQWRDRLTIRGAIKLNLQVS